MESPAGPRAKKVAFLSTVAPGDTPRLETMLGYALAARAMEYEVKIFLALDSALVTKRPIFEKLDAKLRDRITECLTAGVQLDVCQASAQTFSIRAEDLIPGVQIRGIASFFAYAANADINFGWS
ncbi:MAG: DsrE family protein [Thermoplasmata archaeon]